MFTFPSSCSIIISGDGGQDLASLAVFDDNRLRNRDRVDHLISYHLVPHDRCPEQLTTDSNWQPCELPLGESSSKPMFKSQVLSICTMWKLFGKSFVIS